MISLRCKDGIASFMHYDIEKLSHAQALFANCNEYLELTASDNSLEYIKDQFTNLPTRERWNKHINNSFTWHGSMAKTILMNL